MKKLTVVFFLLIASAAFAADSKPSEASVKELLQLSGTPKMLDAMKGQLGAMQAGMLQQTIQGHALTAGVRKVLDEANSKAAALINETLTWSTFESPFVEAYRATLTQEEVDGIVAFYKTTAGKALAEKMPALQQGAGQRMQMQLGPLVEKLKQLQQETVLKLQAEFANQN